MSQLIEQKRFFTILDRLFWIVWLLFPVFMWLVVQGALTESATIADISRVSAVCADLIPQVRNFSLGGKAVVFTYVALAFLIYGVLLAIAHVTIHRFATGQVFVANTLRALGLLGLIVVIWPFFDLAAANLVNYGILLTGDVKTFEPMTIFDVGPLGVGLLILTIRTALQHAIVMKQEQDLTI